MHAIRMPANRWQAFLIHLGISALLYVVLLYLIVFHWYPQPYFAIDGGWYGVQLLTGVDLVLGPTLTLMVYRRGKPGLKLDLTLIALFQGMALVWGTWLVYGQRTAAVVFSSGYFQTLSAEQLVEAGERAVRLAAESDTRPPFFLVRMPADQKERMKLVAQTMATGIPLSKRGDLFEHIGADNRMQLLSSGVDIERRVKDIEDDRAELEAFLARHGGSSSDYAFVPLSARYGSLLLGLSRKDGTVVGALNIRPTRPFARSPATETRKPAS